MWAAHLSLPRGHRDCWRGPKKAEAAVHIFHAFLHFFKYFRKGTPPHDSRPDFHGKKYYVCDVEFHTKCVEFHENTQKNRNVNPPI